jgi:hypothetical protein
LRRRCHRNIHLTDFPAAILAPFQVAAVEPDAFAFQLTATGVVEAAAADHRASMTRPPLSASDYLDALSRNGSPGTAAAINRERI